MLKSRKDEKDETKLLPKGNRNNARRGAKKASIGKARQAGKARLR